MGTDGFEFIELGTSSPDHVRDVLARLGFGAVARHRSKNVLLCRQGDINLVVNHDPASLAQEFVAAGRPAISALAFRVRNATVAYELASDYVAWEETRRAGVMELNIPAIMGVGGTSIYLIDLHGDRSIYDIDFVRIDGADPHPRGAGLTVIDHVAYALRRDEIRGWADSYREVFNFRETAPASDPPYASRTRDLIGPCGKIRLRLAELPPQSARASRGGDAFVEGVRYIGLSTPDIRAATAFVRERGVELVEPDDAYYRALRPRATTHGQPIEGLRESRILLDETPGEDGRACLRVRTKPLLGSLGFELVQRLP